MADSGWIVIVDDLDEEVCLYAHWHGAELDRILADALDSPAGRNRENDAAYLARIIFERMLKEQWDEETGFGIAPRVMDSDNPILYVYPQHQHVLVEHEGVLSFEDFIETFKAEAPANG